MKPGVRIPAWRVVPVVIAVISSLLLSESIAADQVTMMNGDRLTGTVVRSDRSRLRVETDYAGILAIDWSMVRGVRFDEPRRVLLEDDTQWKVGESTRDAGHIFMQGDGPAPSIEVASSRVRVIAPEPWETDEGYQFTGRVDLAAKTEKGNTDKNEVDIDYSIDYRRRRHRFESEGELEFDTDRGGKTKDKWTFLNRYSRLFRSPWYAAGTLFFRHDRFADLRLRSALGPTAGYRFFEGPQRNLRAELGFVYMNDTFYDAPDRDYWGLVWHLASGL